MGHSGTSAEDCEAVGGWYLSCKEPVAGLDPVAAHGILQCANEHSAVGLGAGPGNLLIATFGEK